MTCPLRNERDTILEVSEAWVSWHTTKACIYFFLASDLKTPIDEMIFEDSLMKLMENVGGKTGKYVGLWKICPERVIDWSNPFFCKSSNSLPAGFVFENNFGTFLFSFRKLT